MSKQYQSFPDTPGDSQTLEKLKALCFPPLEGKSFLDVGCNEGFFCGFAKYAGAKRVVGIDFDKEFIRRARIRFPECAFLQQSWDVLPDEKFDVILMASAIHYADDQPRMIRRLLDQLAPGGILILEIGVAQSDREEWVEVKRSIDTRKFPTRKRLQQELQSINSAWKWMGHSVNQAGDPIPRFVLHLSNKKPIAYLLLQPSGYGKTFLSQTLFDHEKFKIIHGDQKIIEVAAGYRNFSDPLGELIKNQYIKNNNIALLIEMIVASNLTSELIDLWLVEYTEGDVVIDSYIPFESHKNIIELVKEKGFMPVQLLWNNVIETRRGGKEFISISEKYFESLAGTTKFTMNPKQKSDRYNDLSEGHIDKLEINSGILHVKGWMVDANGTLPSELAISIGNKMHIVETGEANSRPDVQKHLGLNHDQLGFSIELPISEAYNLSDLLSDNFAVTFITGEPLVVSKSIGNTVNATC